MPELYVPDRDTLIASASRAGVDLARSKTDWECRQWLTPPGLVWSVASDTCCTGRLSAPASISYDQYGAEFVFRQPRDAGELTDIMHAASAETFGCYRFDGLERWTHNAVKAWHELTHVIEGWLEYSLGKERDPEIAAGQRSYLEYLRSHAFRSYISELSDHLRPRLGCVREPVVVLFSTLPPLRCCQSVLV